MKIVLTLWAKVKTCTWLDIRATQQVAQLTSKRIKFDIKLVNHILSTLKSQLNQIHEYEDNRTATTYSYFQASSILAMNGYHPSPVWY